LLQILFLFPEPTQQTKSGVKRSALSIALFSRKEIQPL
jgi:hypothetical protein